MTTVLGPSQQMANGRDEGRKSRYSYTLGHSFTRYLLQVQNTPKEVTWAIRSLKFCSVGEETTGVCIVVV